MTAHKTRMMHCPICQRKTKFDIFPVRKPDEHPYLILERNYTPYTKTIHNIRVLPRYYECNTRHACVKCQSCHRVFDKLTMHVLDVYTDHARILVPIIENGEKYEKVGK